jgi:hypothetical protein
MPNIQKPLVVICPRASMALLKAGYKPHLPVQQRRAILEESVFRDRFGAYGVWNKLDQLVLANEYQPAFRILRRDRNWVMKTFSE